MKAVPNIFATQPTGNVPASYLDTDLALIADANTFSNYFVDTGAANAYVVTFAASTTGSLTAGLPIQFKAANSNTGASTLAVNGMTSKNITNPDATALAAGQIAAGAIINVVYDGTQFKLCGAGQFVGGAIPGPLSSLIAYNTQQALMCYLLPSMSDGWRGIYRAGFDWWSRNQQWGGPFGFMGLLDGATDTVYNGEAATGYLEDNTAIKFGYDNTNNKQSQGLKVAETQTLAYIDVKLYKSGDPSATARLFIYSDTAGSPNALISNGTATALSGKVITSDTNGAIYRFVFAAPPSLTGGTQYHIVMDSSSASTSNYFWWKGTTTSKYPFGYTNVGTNVPAWTPTTTTAMCFLAELSATAQTLQASGQFDGKLQFGGSGASGTLSMSRGLCNSVPLRELMDVTDNTGYMVGTALTKDATFFDTGYGEDHDRIVIRSNVTTGYGQIDVYDSAGTKTTKTATAVDLSSSTHSVGWRVRAKGDGADVVSLYIDGTTYSSTGLTIVFDKNFANLGTMWVGGGFALAPTYLGVGLNGFSGLPSTLTPAWTYNGTATEGSHFSVSAGKLFGNKNASGSTDTSNFSITWVGVNATGTDSVFQLRVVSNTNTKDNGGCAIDHDDGTKRVLSYRQEYYATAAALFYPQQDFKSVENVIHTAQKLTDFYQFTNRRLTVDGSGAAAATSSNRIAFGDISATAGENSDIVYSAAQYLVTGWNVPQFTAGSASEFAIWQGDMTALHPLLYNSGTFVSAEQLLGIPGNYLDKSSKIPAIVQRGITSSPTTTSTSDVLCAELERFVVAESVRVLNHTKVRNGTAGNASPISTYVDGVMVGKAQIDLSNNNYDSDVVLPTTTFHTLGLHKIEGKFASTGATTVTSLLTNRTIEAEPKL
jgi:hypothetical protein